MSNSLQPALTNAEWRDRRCGSVRVDIVGEETHVVVADPDDQLVSVSGADELYALAALALDAMPEKDPRKLSHTDVAVLTVLIDSVMAHDDGPANRLTLALAEGLKDKLVALLPAWPVKRGA